MKKRLISALLALVLCLGLAISASAADFTDVPANYVFYQAIQDSASKKILSGYQDGSFRPAAHVTRAQFAVMLARAFYPGKAESETYAHFASWGWFVPSAAVLEDHGAAAYGHDYWVDPAVMNNAISRNDMARFITRVMEAKGYSVSSEAKAGAQAKISDYDSIPEDFRDEIKTVFALGIISGFADGSFSGKSTMTRGQAAAVIYRMTQYLAANEPGVLTPAAQESAAAPTTLANGKAITEENILDILSEQKAQYPEGTDFSIGYPVGESSPVRLATHPYFRERDPQGHTSNTLGCGGWATLLSDAMFGQEAFTPRKTTLADARPGDIMVQLSPSGLLVHVAIISQRPTVEDGKISFTVTEAATDDQDVYHIYWDRDYTWRSDGKYSYDIYTRYPE